MSYTLPVRPVAPSWPAIDPPPFVTNVMPRPVGVLEPLAVRRLAKTARAAGWSVSVAYSRGLVRTKSVGRYKTVNCWGVWAPLANGWRWYARNESADELVGGPAWTSITVWQPGCPRHGGLTITGLNEFLSVRGSVLPAWFEQFKTEVTP